MKMKSILLIEVATLGLTAATLAQTVPSYVPTNGLVGWWPFNGNANDESGNGNNGTVNGATLTTDRFGNAGKAYSLDGVNDWIQVDYDSILNLGNEFTLSVWINSRPGFGSGAPWADHNHIISRGGGGGPGAASYVLLINSTGNIWLGLHDGIQNYGAPSTHLNNPNQWYLVTTTLKNSVVSYYFNGEKYDSVTNVQPPQNSNFNMAFGREGNSGPLVGSICHLNGIIDDIGIWNRALSQQEIANLFNAVNCSNDLSISPENNQLQTGITTILTAANSDPNPSFNWQTDFGLGFQNLQNVGQYS